MTFRVDKRGHYIQGSPITNSQGSKCLEIVQATSGQESGVQKTEETNRRPGDQNSRWTQAEMVLGRGTQDGRYRINPL